MLFDKEQSKSVLPNQDKAAGRALVDVILVSYNQEKFIAQAIESILAQQTDFTFRLMIGDDASTDNTQTIIRSYAAQHPDRITLLLDSEHRGLKNRDRVGLRALAMATARYIAWLDGDDYWTNPDKLQRQVSFLEGHPDFAISYHNAAMTFMDGSRVTENCLPPRQPAVSTIEDLIRGNFIPTCTTVFRRGLAGELPEWLGTLGMADWPIHILNAQHGKIGYLNEVMASYRIHDGGAWSSAPPSDKSLEVLKMLEHVDAYFGFRYQKQINATKAEWYYELAESAYRDGAQHNCRTYLSKYLSLGRFRLDRRTVSLFLRIRMRGLYQFLRFIRDLGHSTRGPANGVLKNSTPSKS